VIRLCVAEPPPSDQTARPVAAPCVDITDEGLEHDRPRALPFSVLVPVIGDSRVGTAARTRQHKQSRVLVNELAQGTHTPSVIPTTRKQRCCSFWISCARFTGFSRVNASSTMPCSPLNR